MIPSLRPRLAAGSRRRALLLALLALSAPPLLALPKVEKAKLEMHADRTAYSPGASGRLAALMHIEEGWHVNSHQPTYDYLIPTTLEVTLPDGWAAATLTYPKAMLGKFTFAEEELSVYEGTVAIVAAFAVPGGAPIGEVPVVAALTYQACNDTQCLPPVTRRENVVLHIATDGAALDHGYFATAEAQPAGGDGAGVSSPPSAASSAPPAGAAVAATTQGATSSGATSSGATSTAATAAGPAASTPAGDSSAASSAPSAAAPAIAAPAAAAQAATAAAPRPVSGPRTATPPATHSLAWMLAIAFLGGVILNAMPCVLPILSIKVFGLVKSASLSRRAVTVSSLATTLGILASFWALAGAAIAARAAGAAVGWGVQFQEPAFVGALVVLVVLFSLNMWGLFEIQLPQRLAAVAGSGPQEGPAGHFVTGLFATLMATPCSAPFLGSAVGFALTQGPAVVLSIFTAIGLGMAAPYLLLAVRPGAAKLLPKPGMWMVRLKEIMGFLLAAAAVWLLYVLSQQVSREWLAFFELALLGLCLIVFLGRGARPGWPSRSALLAALAGAVGAVWIAAAAPPAAPTGSAAGDGSGIAWVPFDRQRAEELAERGTPVFLDVTADWCVTCKVNERVILESETVRAAFASNCVVPMRADWTNYDERIGALLADHGRFGIPFYMVYRADGPPNVLPELLSSETVLSALEGSAAPGVCGT